MADVFSPEVRASIMSKVRSKGNVSTEKRLISLLRRHRIKGWRRNYRLLGSPDFVWPAKKIALFVDGCFWHGCPIHSSIPTTNRDYWETKLKRNRERDVAVNQALSDIGWQVIRLWECDLARKREAATMTRLAGVLSG